MSLWLSLLILAVFSFCLGWLAHVEFTTWHD